MKRLSLAVVLLASCQLHALGADRSPLPAPTGKHSVGRTLFHWIDESLPDPDIQDGHREIIVWAWYPATVTPKDQPAEWMPGKWGEVFGAAHLKSHPGAISEEQPIGSILSHAYPNAAGDTSRRYPILLFAPGLGNTPLDYTTIIEDVASHGYIVLGVVSPEFGRARVLSDGRVFQGHDPAEWAARRGGSPSRESAWRAFEETRIYSRDLRFALTALANVQGGPLKGRADLSRVGVFGHSLGGAAALRCARDDARVRAVFDIDGSPIWSSDEGALHKPLLVLSAASTSARYDTVLAGAMPGRHLRLAGTEHAFSKDLQVLPFVLKGSPTSDAGANLISPARALRVTAVFAQAFFNQYLNGNRERLLDGPAVDYPEVGFVTTQPRGK